MDTSGLWVGIRRVCWEEGHCCVPRCPCGCPWSLAVALAPMGRACCSCPAACPSAPRWYVPLTCTSPGLGCWRCRCCRRVPGPAGPVLAGVRAAAGRHAGHLAVRPAGLAPPAGARAQGAAAHGARRGARHAGVGRAAWGGVRAERQGLGAEGASAKAVPGMEGLAQKSAICLPSLSPFLHSR